jgi:hypothetical protein
MASPAPPRPPCSRTARRRPGPPRRPPSGRATPLGGQRAQFGDRPVSHRPMLRPARRNRPLTTASMASPSTTLPHLLLASNPQGRPFRTSYSAPSMPTSSNRSAASGQSQTLPSPRPSQRLASRPSAPADRVPRRGPRRRPTVVHLYQRPRLARASIMPSLPSPPRANGNNGSGRRRSRPRREGGEGQSRPRASRCE